MKPQQEKPTFEVDDRIRITKDIVLVPKTPTIPAGTKGIILAKQVWGASFVYTVQLDDTPAIHGWEGLKLFGIGSIEEFAAKAVKLEE